MRYTNPPREIDAKGTPGTNMTVLSCIVAYDERSVAGPVTRYLPYTGIVAFCTPAIAVESVVAAGLLRGYFAFDQLARKRPRGRVRTAHNNRGCIVDFSDDALLAAHAGCSDLEYFCAESGLYVRPLSFARL